MEQKKSIWIKLFYFIAIFLLITWSFSTYPYGDENFTLGLIKHNWLQIINLDAMDVHPPLYYLILKAFLNITTFWTSSMVIKAIFARLFSVICFAIMSKGIQLIFKKSLDKNISFNIIFLGLLLLPNVLYHATCIRMYAFGAMLITWEFVCLIDYRQQNKTSYLIYALILAEMAAYTHYFAAIIGGLLLVYEFLSTIKHKQFNSAIKLGISGIALLILFIPWGMIAFKQVSNVSHHYWMPKSLDNFVDLFYYHAFPIYALFYFGFILLLILTILCYQKGSISFKFIYRRVLFIFYGTMLIGITISIIIRPIFQSRYLFFIFPLYLCLTFYELFKILNTQKKSLRIIGLIILIFLSLGIMKNTIKGARYVVHNVITYNQLMTFKKQNKDYIILPPNDFAYSLEYSIYLPNKTIYITHYNTLIDKTINTGNFQRDEILFKNIYPNIKPVEDK